jgi:sulfide:quinone oxidoreductase
MIGITSSRMKQQENRVMERKRIVIAGCNFAGYAGALELHQLLGTRHQITVIARSPLFVFTPSLVLIPFGMRDVEEITFDVRPVLAERSIEFRQEGIQAFDPDNRQVITDGGTVPYDYLLIGLGREGDLSSIPGLAEAGTFGIWSLEQALRAREGWNSFLENPGPAVIGLADGAPPLAAPYEFILNAQHQLAERELADRAQLTFLTSEPQLARFGPEGFADAQVLCERTFGHLHIAFRTGIELAEVGPDHVRLVSGEEIPSRFTMIVPPFTGPAAVRRSPGLGDGQGYVPIDAYCRHPDHPAIYAAGTAVSLAPGTANVVVGGIPTTIYPAERMGRSAARNIAAALGEHVPEELPFEELAAYTRRDMQSATQHLSDLLAGQRAFEAISPTERGQARRESQEHYYMTARRHGTL